MRKAGREAVGIPATVGYMIIEKLVRRAALKESTMPHSLPPLIAG